MPESADPDAQWRELAGEVLKGGRSARTREGAGSIPAAGSDSPAANAGSSFTLHK